MGNTFYGYGVGCKIVTKFLTDKMLATASRSYTLNLGAYTSYLFFLFPIAYSLNAYRLGFILDTH